MPLNATSIVGPRPVDSLVVSMPLLGRWKLSERNSISMYGRKRNMRYESSTYIALRIQKVKKSQGTIAYLDAKDVSCPHLDP
jgi:hypothetical protein